MQPNLLDDFFRNQLKDKSKMPDNIPFRKATVLSAINAELNARSSKTHWFKYAAILLLLILSGYWHLMQQQIIDSQNQQVAQCQGIMEEYRSEAERLYKNQLIEIDSLKKNLKQPITEEKLQMLPSLPAIVTVQKLVVAPTIDITVYEPIYITDKDIPNQKSTVPELDLPVYYESERLANNTDEASKGRAFTRKLSQLINN